MNYKKNILNLVSALVLGSIVFVACGDSQSPGVEYMPDMYRSPAMEVYVDYEFPDSATSRKAPENSIPIGYKPYPYTNDLEGFELAGNNLINPLALTEKTIKEGKKLYESFCAHCHGKRARVMVQYKMQFMGQFLHTLMKHLTEEVIGQ